ncbi:MAG: hypothetical protein M0018_05590 [Nitrospiraceae bacterium]|nr:hypothetical protein [Nitrospiraceae bacterium]
MSRFFIRHLRRPAPFFLYVPAISGFSFASGHLGPEFLFRLFHLFHLLDLIKRLILKDFSFSSMPESFPVSPSFSKDIKEIVFAALPRYSADALAPPS